MILKDEQYALQFSTIENNIKQIEFLKNSIAACEMLLSKKCENRAFENFCSNVESSYIKYKQFMDIKK